MFGFQPHTLARFTLGRFDQVGKFLVTKFRQDPLGMAKCDLPSLNMPGPMTCMPNCGGQPAGLVGNGCTESAEGIGSRHV